MNNIALSAVRIQEIADLNARLKHVQKCAAATSTGETVMHHSLVAEIIRAMTDLATPCLELAQQKPTAFTDSDELAEMNAGSYASMFNPEWVNREEDSRWQPLYAMPFPAFMLINRLQIALARMLTMHEMVMNKTNIKASFYDADCIREMNEAPIQARRVLLDIKDGAA
ncbi:hypothetical protein EUY23_02815 [Salmonella enterica]|nr:hypothetical protein [Salmonella enterica]EJH8994044.1 hypothetical protein [Salmonella enterica]EKJ5691577.1 hypothetical protein [Salmonella enterica]